MRSTDVGPAAPATRTPAGSAAHRAARVVAPGRTEVVRVQTWEPAPAEVRIRFEGCGICASNLPFWEGRDWFDYPGEPGAPGHEGWGIVEAVGEDVTRVRAGDRVAALTHHAFAERDYALEDHVAVLPRELEGVPFPGEPLGCAVNVFLRAEVREGHQVAVVGTGFIGSILVALCKRAGARVLAVSRRRSSLEMAEQFGADESIPLRGDPATVVARVEALTGGKLCERVIEATGKQAPLDLAARITGVRGRLVVAGYHQDGSRSVDLQLWNWRGIDVINAHERDPATYMEGIRRAAHFAANGLDPRPLYSHTVGLERLDDAFRLLEGRPEGFTKALVVMS